MSVESTENKNPDFGGEGALRREVISSVAWVTTTSFAVRALAAVSSLILAKLLAPEVFGIIAAANVIIAAMEIFSDFGINRALIQYQGDLRRASNVTLTLRLTQGVILFIIAAASAGEIAYFYQTPALRLIIIVLGFNFIISAAGTVPMTLLSRDLRFKRQLLPQAVPAALQMITAVSMAVAGFGVWSIVAGMVVMNTSKTILYWSAAPYKLKLEYDSVVTKHLFSFGLPLFGAGLVLYCQFHLDKMLVGKLLGMEQLGYYSFAFIIINLPSTEIIYLLNRVMFPAYSLIGRQRRELRSAYLKSLKYIMLIIAPLSIAIPIMGGNLFHALYHSKWDSAIAPLQAFGVFAFMRALSAIFGNLFLAIGKTRFLFIISVITLIIKAAFIYPSIMTWGITGAAGLYSVAWTAQIIISVIYLKKWIGAGFVEICERLKYPLLASCVSILPIKYLDGKLIDLNHPLTLIISVIFIIILYSVLMMKFDKETNISVKESWKKRRLVLI
ncbi:MAG: lipopolysaccharide biosynthesis protein [FCB group bacterium]|nr:lipopolysaccharide biosynthesis protein [FCB group bacterium]